MESSSRASGTKTQVDQWILEQIVGNKYAYFEQLPPSVQSIELMVHRDQHLEYLTNSLRNLGQSCMDASRPMLCYYIIQSIALLGVSVDEELKNNTIDFLSRCQDPEGGYGGGPGQLPHLAVTCAAINTLITLGGEKALSSINRKQLYAFFMRMKDTISGGGFRMHEDGEIDVRASYIVISVASLLNILDDQLVENVGNYNLSCQTYEGGIAGEPNSEAHGGYTFCGVSAMILIDEVHRLDLNSLIDWIVFKQGVEGGFQGRTNKLVDGCYSFWQGAVAAIVQRLCSDQLGLSESDPDCLSSDLSDVEEHVHEHAVKGTCSTSESDPSDCALSDLSDVEEHVHAVRDTCSPRQCQASASGVTTTLSDIGYKFISRKGAFARPIFNSMDLQKYILLCSQVEAGFRDKPGKSRDSYHTCYCLAGLAICQYSCLADTDSLPLPKDVLGSYYNLLEPNSPFVWHCHKTVSSSVSIFFQFLNKYMPFV